MKGFLFALAIIAMIAIVALTSCLPASVNDVEQAQQRDANMAIVQNQPIPDLGGYSFERQIVIETYLARNNTVATYAYMISMDGKIIEICPSIGYPIPYSTQLTSPEKGDVYYSEAIVLPNAEPNSLYVPPDAAATLVQCVNKDGSVSPVYIEWYVLAFPFQIASDVQLQRMGEPSFTVQIK